MLRNTLLSDLAKPIPFLTRAARQGRNYSSVIIWLLYRACRGSAYKLTIAVALSLAHLACQGAAIFAIYWYGRRMEKAGDVTLPVLKIAVNFRDQPEWLWLAVIFSTVCFVMSAGFLYLSRRVIYDAVERHFAHKIEELMLELKKRYTIAIVTHNLQQAQRVADKTGFLYVDTTAGGRTGYLVEYGDSKQMFESPKEKYTQDYIRGEFS